ncbi:MAG: OsmC family protein [Caldilineales bacterium]|nr:OsmC family protein [Caldilineales bacterium]MDW8318415.1 OsmC family protein [Anaerolineae bacterium]
MAKQVSVKWLEKRQFVGIGGTKRAVVMSGQDEENLIGVSPSELLLIALAGCSAYDVVSILEKKKTKLSGLTVNVTGEQEADPPWPYRRIHLEYIVRGKGLTDKAVADAIHLSETKYCSVAATVRPTAEITTSFQIVEEE